MENLGLYCRFCAEPKDPARLFHLYSDEKKCHEIHIKLSFLNALFYIDVSASDLLPKTVCFACYDSLNKAYDFFNKVKKAQEKLKLLSNCSATDEDENLKLDFSIDDDRTALDEFFGETHDVEVKEETSPTKPNHEAQQLEVKIKLEPKEEIPDSNIIQGSLVAIQVTDTNINLHDILDSSLKEGLYAKEVKDARKRIKSWKEFVWVCAFCNMQFTDIETFRLHCIETHDQCAAFTCTECRTFTRTDGFEAFVKHVQRKHRKGLRNRCQYCDEAIVLSDIDSHVKQHLEGKFVCSSCGQILPNAELLQNHLALTDVKKKKTVKKARQRRKPGQPITEEELTCPMCKHVYKNLNSLRDHMKRHTSVRHRNYTCDRCGKSFLSKGTLTTHVMAHDKIRPYTCRICNKSFVFPNMLKRHVEMHSGVKPFSCEICGRGFRLQYQLKMHKIIHTDAMPHVCQYCNKAFRFRQILVNHERQHTGIKPYSCEHCCMEFTNWSNYNKHMKRRHNFNTAKKKITPDGTFPINPETGQVIQVDMEGKDMDEWKSKIMIPGKRGKKKRVTVKQEYGQN